MCASISIMATMILYSSSFFFNDPATTEIYTLSLHDALPIYCGRRFLLCLVRRLYEVDVSRRVHGETQEDRKSTRLNSSHGYISYAVFCLKKKRRRSRRSKLPLRSQG